MAWAEPQDPRFFELALQHHYPLRHLSIAELLPVCRLDSYLAQVGAGRCTTAMIYHQQHSCSSA